MTFTAAGPLLAAGMLVLAAAPLPRAATALSSTETAALVKRLAWSSAPAGLRSLRLRAIEEWTQAEVPPGARRVRNRETDEVSFYHGVPLELQLTRNDLPLSAGAERKQASALGRMQRRVDAACGSGDGSDGRLLSLGGEVWTMARFASGFAWSGAPAAAGRVELSFEPLPGRRPGSRLARILGATAGQLEVDPASGQILGGEFHNIAPVRFGGGLLAHFTDFHGRFRLQPAAGTWVLRSVEVTIEGRELFHRIHGTETMTYTVEPPQ
ncbi:MAG: hypothetical protein ACRD1E_04110 [Terriglobales bacterium]